jgi:AcrR family transcriptional regulator
LRLLWRHQQPLRPRRGPRPAHTVDDVVNTAISLADHTGLEALGMRQVAEALGVSTMSLYTYVPGKTELVSLMVDTVYARMPSPPLAGIGWRQRLGTVADTNRALVQAHPWLVSISTARPPLGPGVMAKYEHELSAFDGLGLDDVTVDDCLTLLLTFVNGLSRAAVAARAAEQASGFSDEQWWEANAPLLASMFDPNTFPRAARIGTAAGAANGSAYDPTRAYEFGLNRILDAITALLPAPPADPALPSVADGQEADLPTQ